MKVHLIVEQDDGTLMGLSSEAALVEIERTADLDEFAFGPGAPLYARPINERTTLTLELMGYTVFRPDARPWPRAEVDGPRQITAGWTVPDGHVLGPRSELGGMVP